MVLAPSSLTHSASGDRLFYPLAGGILVRKWQILASIFAFLVVCGEAEAGDKEDILARLDDVYSAWNTGDVDALPFIYHTAYHVKGGLLETINDPEKWKAWRKGDFAAGLTINARPFHQKVDVYGKTAVYTCYERININPPNGEPVNDTRRITVVLVKQKGEWNGVHLHASYLKPVNPE
jgi:hypothetical protein